MRNDPDLIIVMNAFCQVNKIRISVFKHSKLHKHAKLRYRFIMLLKGAGVKPKNIANLLGKSLGYIYMH